MFQISQGLFACVNSEVQKTKGSGTVIDLEPVATRPFIRNDIIMYSFAMPNQPYIFDEHADFVNKVPHLCELITEGLRTGPVYLTCKTGKHMSRFAGLLYLVHARNLTVVNAMRTVGLPDLKWNPTLIHIVNLLAEEKGIPGIKIEMSKIKDTETINAPATLSIFTR